MKRPPVAAIALMILFAATAQANAGAPLIAIFIVRPLIWLVLIPIVIIEMFMARRIIGIPAKRALALSASANAVSTLIGVPLTMFVFLPNARMEEAALLRRDLPDPGLLHLRLQREMGCVSVCRS